MGASELLEIAKSCKGSSEVEVLKVFNENIGHISKLDEGEQKIVLDGFGKAGKIKTNALASVLNTHEREKKISKDSKQFRYNNSTYVLNEARMLYTKTVEVKKDIKVMELSDCLVDLQEIRKQIDGEGNKISLYKGVIKIPRLTPSTTTAQTEATPEKKKDKDKKEGSEGDIDPNVLVVEFSIPEEDWHNRKKFAQMIGQITDNNALVDEKYAEEILRCVKNFCTYKVRSVLTEFGYYGQDKSVYFTPSVVIDGGGIRPNNKEQEMDLSAGRIAAHADMTILSEQEFKDVTKQFVTDMTTITSTLTTLPIIGHYFMMPIIGRLDITDGEGRSFINKPTLWIDGLYAKGKTSYVRLLNSLYGNFYHDTMKESWVSTWNLISKEGTQMKDLPFLVDDYKQNALPDPEAATKIINPYYDGTGRRTLKRDGTYNQERVIKGYLVSTGEDVLKDASTISRCVLVHYENPARMDLDKYGRCEKNTERYRGIMPYYIHYLYSFTNGDFIDFINRKQREIIRRSNQSGDARISKNLAFVWAGFTFMAECFFKYGVITLEQKDELMAEMTIAMDKIAARMFGETYDAQSSNMFIEVLGSLIENGSVRILGYNEQLAEHKPVVGFIDIDADMSPKNEFVYLYSRSAFAEVTQFMKKTNDSMKHSIKAVTAQLLHEHIIVGTDDGRSTTRKRNGSSPVERVWQLRKTSLGMRDKIRAVITTTESSGSEEVSNSSVTTEGSSSSSSPFQMR